MDATRRIYRNGAIAIVGNRIHSVGQDSEISGSVSARETLDGNGFVITPGFVNCHVHITGEPLTRGIVPDNTDWAENVFGWLIPMYMTQTPADERLSAQFAALEMLRTGTTTFIEAGTILNLEAVADGLAEIGIRGRIGQWLQDRAFAPDDDQTALTDSALSRMDDQSNAYPQTEDALISAWPLLARRIGSCPHEGLGCERPYERRSGRS